MATEKNNNNYSYTCKHGFTHNYNKINIKAVENDTDGKIYDNVENLKKELKEELE